MATDRDNDLAEIARRHLGFGSLTRQNSDDRDFREVPVWKVRAALEAAFAAGQAAPKTCAPKRAPDCATGYAAQIAGVIAEAVMAGEMNFDRGLVPEAVEARMPRPDTGPVAALDRAEGARVAGLMICARARASVRTPGHAALSGAEAALALVEDALAIPTEGDDVPDLFAVAEAIRDTLRAGLAPLHAAEADPAAA